MRRPSSPPRPKSSSRNPGKSNRLHILSRDAKQDQPAAKARRPAVMAADRHRITVAALVRKDAPKADRQPEPKIVRPPVPPSLPSPKLQSNLKPNRKSRNKPASAGRQTELIIEEIYIAVNLFFFLKILQEVEKPRDLKLNPIVVPISVLHVTSDEKEN